MIKQLDYYTRHTAITMVALVFLFFCVIMSAHLVGITYGYVWQLLVSIVGGLLLGALVGDSFFLNRSFKRIEALTEEARDLRQLARATAQIDAIIEQARAECQKDHPRGH